MSKGSFFTGQPIFNQLLNYIPRGMVRQVAREQKADHYCKSFRTYDHLVTMLYATFNQCTSLREVTTGLLAWENRIHHLGIKDYPRRSTLADANKHRSAEVFEQIYFRLLANYRPVLPDSRKRSKKNNLYIFDSTSIALFKEILKGSGLSRQDGKRKGGIKVHTLLHARTDVPVMIRYSASAANDAAFLREVRLPEGSVVVFDKGYRNYAAYNRLAGEQITWVTRHRDSSVYQIKKRLPVNEHQCKNGIAGDWIIELGHDHTKKAIKVKARMIVYRDPATKKLFCFISNNFKLAPLTIAGYYRQRWQIETFFRRIKQNYPVQYFLGDNENAIKIQIWCAIIADLLLKVIRQGCRSSMSFSNIAGLIRMHMMTYMDIKSFLSTPEQSLLRKIRHQKEFRSPSLFPT
jgi:IS5 family transposase